MAYLDGTELSAEEIVRKSLGIASDICIYTNSNITIEILEIE
jgi:ATP-dependent HslUV protease subunit HslV